MLLRKVSVLALAISFSSGCSSQLANKAFTKKEVEPGLMQTVNNPVSDEEAQRMLSTGGKNWVMGNGIGDAMVNVGTSIIFPPYLVYLLGNGAIEMAGYHGVYVTEALPDSYKKGWDGLYDSVTSVPGRAVATASGSEFRTKDKIASEGGFWGKKGTAVAAKSGDSLFKDEMTVAVNQPEIRNDLYGSDRTGS